MHTNINENTQLLWKKNLYLKKKKIFFIFFYSKNIFLKNPFDKNNTKIKKLYGRIVNIRFMGKSLFLNIICDLNYIQVYTNINLILPIKFNFLKKLDVGDYISVHGFWFYTNTQQSTLKMIDFIIFLKTIKPLPKKWVGFLKSKRFYKERFLDILINQKSQKIFLFRNKTITFIRSFLQLKNFIEVETPILQKNPGGAVAKPFKTHLNFNSKRLFLRISLEIYLKKILVSGFEKIFELGKVFRNEGISNNHNLEFTMLEIYICFTDFRCVMKLIYNLIQTLLLKLMEKKFLIKNNTYIKFIRLWKTLNYFELIKFFLNKYDFKLYRRNYVIKLKIMSKLIEPTLIQPIFIKKFPKDVCPLAEITKSNRFLLNIFELFIDGKEIAPGYSEQNNIFVQSKLFKKQNILKNTIYDKFFLNALSYGIPPSGGLGVGLDRLIMIISKVKRIKDVIFFSI